MMLVNAKKAISEGSKILTYFFTRNVPPVLPHYSAHMHGNLQAGPLARISTAGVKNPIQNNNIDSEVPDVKTEPESVQLEENSCLPAEGQGGEHPGPGGYDHFQEQCSQI